MGNITELLARFDCILFYEVVDDFLSSSATHFTIAGKAPERATKVTYTSGQTTYNTYFNEKRKKV